MTARVLVTGGGGFIGSHLVDSQLAKGHHVRTIDLNVERLGHVAGHSNLQIVIGDITNRDLLNQLVEGIDVIYHLASAHLDLNIPDRQYWRVNVDATIDLIRAASTTGVKRMIHCSSNGVLGNIKSLPADENTPCNPTNIYEVTKLAGEQAALKLAHEVGMPVVVVRPSWVYGPRCPRTQKLFRQVKKGRFLFFGDGRTLRHPVYITDAVRGLELCAEAGNAVGQIYFIAGECAVTIEELVEAIAEVLEVRPPKIHLPIALGKVAGYIVPIVFKTIRKQPPFSRRGLDFFLKDNAYDIRTAQRGLRYQPQVDLHTGLKMTLSWINSRGVEKRIREN